MKPQDVHYAMVRDYPWKLHRCDICGRMVPWFHEHTTRKDGEIRPVRAQAPKIKGAKPKL